MIGFDLRWAGQQHGTLWISGDTVLYQGLRDAANRLEVGALRTMERDGLVSRAITPWVPIRVDYQLTALGQTVLPVVAAIKHWSETHIREIETARASYDRARHD